MAFEFFNLSSVYKFQWHFHFFKCVDIVVFDALTFQQYLQFQSGIQILYFNSSQLLIIEGLNFKQCFLFSNFLTFELFTVRDVLSFYI